MRLPGDKNKSSILEEMIRVNHAGEYGAQRIYQGQIDVLKNDPECLKTLEHMKEQEEEHLEIFSGMMKTHKVRPTLLQPFWHVAGYALGAIPAMVSKEAAMAVTVAVEETIEDHYNQQLAQLGDSDAELKDTIARIRDEEIEHRDIGIENNAQHAVAYPVLYNTVKFGCKTAIALAKKI